MRKYLRAAAGQVAVEAGADSDKYPPGWLFHQKWTAGRGRGPAPTLDGHRIEVAKVAGRVRRIWLHGTLCAVVWRVAYLCHNRASCRGTCAP